MANAKKSNQEDGQADQRKDGASRQAQRDALAELRQRADRGDPEAQQALREFLDENPQVWQKIGDMAAQAEVNLIRLIAKEDFLLTEAIRRKAAELRQRLAGAFPTPLEQMAVERVVSAWLHAQHVDAQCARAGGGGEDARFWLKQQTQAHRLYDAAMRALVLVQKHLPGMADPLVTPALDASRGCQDPGRSKGRSTNGRESSPMERPPGSNGSGAALVPGDAEGFRQDGDGLDEPWQRNGHGANRVAAFVGGKTAEDEPLTV